MGESAATTLARLRVCRDAGVPVPPDLLDAAIMLAERLLSARERKQLRDRELRLAALILPANDALWTKAGQLLKEARAMARRRPASIADPVRLHLHRADELGGLPSSQKQFLRILAANDDMRTP